MEFDRNDTPFGNVIAEFHYLGCDYIVKVSGTKGKGFIIDPACANQHLTPEALRYGEPYGILLSYPEDTTGKILTYELAHTGVFSGRKMREVKADMAVLFEKCPDYVRDCGIQPPKPMRKQTTPSR